MDMHKEATKYTHRYLARIIMEAETPMKVGNGEKDMASDSLVAVDANGLPYIPGSALAGILRKVVSEETAGAIFGCQKESVRKSEGKGSEIIFSEARMLGKDGRIMDGLQPMDWDDGFYARFREFPVRQHVRINDRGAACDAGKYDEQVVFKGCRFAFEMELLYGVEERKGIDPAAVFSGLLSELQSGRLRIGGGTRHGFGKFKVVEMKAVSLDLRVGEDRSEYIGKTSALDDPFWEKVPEVKTAADGEGPDWICYTLELRPDDFFLFASGEGDDDADMTPVTEAYISWNEGKARFVDSIGGRRNIVVPASSIKGALAHRTAYWWNLAEGRFAGKEEEQEKGLAGKDNPAVVALFGTEGRWDPVKRENVGQKRGNVLLEDLVFSPDAGMEKVLNHVCIDRFTGGTIEGALFSEKVNYGNGQSFPPMKIYVAASVDEKALCAFEAALKDLVSGMLPLGGGVNRGMGCFSGTLKKGDKILHTCE